MVGSNFDYCNNNEYIMVYRDDFNTLDTRFWKFGTAGGGNDAYFYPNGGNNVVIQNGILKIITKKDPGYRMVNGISKFYPYSSGRIESKRYFEFGLYNLYCQVPDVTVKATWPAFWFFGGGHT